MTTRQLIFSVLALLVLAVLIFWDLLFLMGQI